ncbi:MAG: DUF2459 domain-containing protein [Kiritimatiellae bacterium]|nr:DUF2459 domain-containing protein [Kiritimatiellia bacterium]
MNPKRKGLNARPAGGWACRRWPYGLGAGWLALLVFSCGCAGPVPGLYPPTENSLKRRVYVIDHGRHTGLIVPTAPVGNPRWFDAARLARQRHMEVGWGEAYYNLASEPTSGTLVRALCWPTPSILHVTGIEEPVLDYYPHRGLIRVDLSEKGFNALCAFLGETFLVDARGQPVCLQASLIGCYGLYRANGTYHFPRTSNVWTARALRAAGCPISPVCAFTSGTVMRRARRFGKVLRE